MIINLILSTKENELSNVEAGLILFMMSKVKV